MLGWPRLLFSTMDLKMPSTARQIFRRIKLSDVPRVKDEDAIVVHDGVQSVRDGQNRGIAKIFTYPEEEDILSAV